MVRVKAVAVVAHPASPMLNTHFLRELMEVRELWSFMLSINRWPTHWVGTAEALQCVGTPSRRVVSPTLTGLPTQTIMPPT